MLNRVCLLRQASYLLLRKAWGRGGRRVMAQGGVWRRRGAVTRAHTRGPWRDGYGTPLAAASQWPRLVG